MSKLLLPALGLFALLGCGQPTVDVVVPLAIVAVSPHDGSTGIDLAAVPTVCFSQDMDAAKAEGSLLLETESGVAVSGQSVKAAGSVRCLSIAHDALTADTNYVVHAKLGLKAGDDSEFKADVLSHFHTAPQ
jgi:hypothetical protein